MTTETMRIIKKYFLEIILSFMIFLLMFFDNITKIIKIRNECQQCQQFQEKLKVANSRITVLEFDKELLEAIQIQRKRPIYYVDDLIKNNRLN